MLFEDYNYEPYNKFVLVDPAKEETTSQGNEDGEVDHTEQERHLGGPDGEHGKMKYEQVDLTGQALTTVV